MNAPRQVVAEPSEDETVSSRIVASIADLLGTDPEDLNPLNRDVDTDALEGLFDGVDDQRPGPRVELRTNGCRVVVEGDGRVVAERPSGDS